MLVPNSIEFSSSHSLSHIVVVAPGDTLRVNYTNAGLQLINSGKMGLFLV
jgi:hypothetical protein